MSSRRPRKDRATNLTAPSRLKVPADDAREKIANQIALGDALANRGVSNEIEFENWELEVREWTQATSYIIERVFDSNRENQDFSWIRASPRFSGFNSWAKNQNAETQDLRRRISVLRVIHPQLDSYELTFAPEPATTSAALPVQQLERLLYRFHKVVRQLQRRHQHRSTLVVEDEYDVQDLLHALLRIFFDDIRNEEWTPSYAGKSSRVDFLLKRERLVIEIKKTRQGLGAKEIGDELLVDIGRYRVHPDCQMLVCFVYDPDDEIGNPAGLEADLSRTTDGLLVKVIVAPKSN